MAKRLRQSDIESAFKLRKRDPESESQPAIDTDESVTDPEVLDDADAELMATSQALSKAEPSECRCNCLFAYSPTHTNFDFLLIKLILFQSNFDD